MRHLGLRSVVRQESVVQNEPSLLVALYVVGPFLQIAAVRAGAETSWILILTGIIIVTAAAVAVGTVIRVVGSLATVIVARIIKHSTAICMRLSGQ